MFPARSVGTAISTAAFAGNISGMAILEAAGWSLDKGYGYAPLLTVCGVSYLIALLLVQLLVPRIVLSESSVSSATIAFH
jgi:ACS family hexuronate transporter-like MFS transporter